MKLCSFLIVVKDIEKARQYYRNLFGLEMLADNDGNMLLSGGLVLQAEDIWRSFTGRDILPRSNACELYFEDENVDDFYQRLITLYPETEVVNPPMTHEWGQHVVRFYDPDGTLIEVGTPMPAADTAKDAAAMIETRRLRIYAASDAQMRAFIGKQSDDFLREAYTEMLNSSLAHPEDWPWYALRMIELKDGTHIGELCFKGILSDGSTEIGYGIDEEYRGRGYASEAVSAVVDSALMQPRISCVTAETEENNAASQRVLLKAGFSPTGKTGEEGPLFIRRK